MQEKFKKYDINLSENQSKKFEDFLSLFVEKNSQVNLSGIRDKDGIIEKHFIDSLILTKYIKLEGKVLDLGTGGGFPGIPLKIIDDDNGSFTLLDSVGKKVTAVNEFVESLKLENIKGIQGRAEELGVDKKHRGKYDYVVSRSVAFLPILLEYTIPLLKIGGIFVAYKLDNYEEVESAEKAMKELKCRVDRVERYSIDGQERILLFIKKIAKTPAQYPRNNKLIQW